MTTPAKIIAMQRRVGANPDSHWGPKSIKAAQDWARALCPDNPWPDTDQKSLRAFYGDPGDESMLVNMPVPAGVTVAYLGTPVKTIRCHKNVKDSLQRILARLSTVDPAILLEYAGVYNNRPMRNGRLPSLHARGAAIDVDPANNGNLTNWPMASTMSLDVIEVFAIEGWTSAAIWWGRDAMHFQATKP